MLVGGDFDILRWREDKNNDKFNPIWSFMFIAIIETLDLRKFGISGRQFSSAKRRENLSYKKSDHILATAGWEHKFSLVSVRALTRQESDHTPLLID
jgi:endonuclease/exonuclease/phosphatase family metal-dependent hydrolase